MLSYVHRFICIIHFYVMEEFKSYDQYIIDQKPEEQHKHKAYIDETNDSKGEIEEETLNLIDSIIEDMENIQNTSIKLIFSNLKAILEENDQYNIASILQEKEILSLIINIIHSSHLTIEDNKYLIEFFNVILNNCKERSYDYWISQDYVVYLMNCAHEGLLSQYVYNYGLTPCLAMNETVFHLLIQEHWIDFMCESYSSLLKEISTEIDEAEEINIFFARESIKSTITIGYIMVGKYYSFISEEDLSKLIDIFIHSFAFDFCRNHSIYALFLLVKIIPNHETGFLSSDDIQQILLNISLDSNQAIAGYSLYIIRKMLLNNQFSLISELIQNIDTILENFCWVELTKPAKYILKIMQILVQDPELRDVFLTQNRFLFFDSIINDMEFNLKQILLNCIMTAMSCSTQSFIESLINSHNLIEEILSLTEEIDPESKNASILIDSLYSIILFLVNSGWSCITLEEVQNLISLDFIIDYLEIDSQNKTKAKYIVQVLESNN
ncbi:hypothetical protein TVAG_299570 [Trichomonas vaginalis G3]|uniref:Uncharacterized protein n=1 Tax=Trichomonas vaginalis (strain ATCC PRA-98 / G3) TaxID=412133 RepID=A2FE69_TRIV3|nr:hypothetical protein TVAGG3_0706260 [Trichomonas vaginalis G3]EAX96798.1 hypothetical protein TVAG_299570 [Trichomonas vaginalis G3]KAI5509589.1 hypothetical protein TVAGG3_0706260 [Trichomonas vaginalis G3]|eukprot:XP_001309728.1 hypothetical protein [Trichomonas vaginalis G3]